MAGSTTYYNRVYSKNRKGNNSNFNRFNTKLSLDDFLKSQSIKSVIWGFEETYTNLLPYKKIEGTRVVVIRDPYNLWASRYKAYKSFSQEEYSMYIEHINSSFYTINYNNWFTSIDYRKQISLILGLEFSDKNLNMITNVGSSFSGRDYDGKAQEMKVLERYKLVIKEKEYLMFFEEHPELEKIALDVFDMKKPF